jgi:hypothetical protein
MSPRLRVGFVLPRTSPHRLARAGSARAARVTWRTAVDGFERFLTTHAYLTAGSTR